MKGGGGLYAEPHGNDAVAGFESGWRWFAPYKLQLQRGGKFCST